MTSAAGKETLRQSLFPGGIPRLWCPPLTHYDDGGSIDLPRMKAHFRHLSPWVRGFLIPGTTGDGWLLDDGETETVVRFALDMAKESDVRILIGLLRQDTGDVLGLMDRIFGVLKELTGRNEPLAVFREARVAGFTVCAPKGKDLGQEEILRSLFQVADRGLPMALYQLPQVTENEIAPETFDRICRSFGNILFFKDSSGGDRIARSAREREGIFFVRGAEGGYCHWLLEAGGPYDGFLLSTANCFAPELAAVIESTERGDLASASELSDAVTAVFGEVSALVAGIPSGNVFTNANKAMDHFFARGEKARTDRGPVLHGGFRIPEDILEKTGDILRRAGFFPGKGYLESPPEGKE
jgi:dihydrodipicolinate synthase/N-acetylneuraminate lyase